MHLVSIKGVCIYTYYDDDCGTWIKQENDMPTDFENNGNNTIILQNMNNSGTFCGI